MKKATMIKQKISRLRERVKSGKAKWLSEVKKYFGVAPLIYTNTNIYKTFISSDSVLKKYDLWIANPGTTKPEIATYGSFCRIECAKIPYKHRHSERFKVLSCKIELFNSSIGHFAG